MESEERLVAAFNCLPEDVKDAFLKLLEQTAKNYERPKLKVILKGP